MRILVLSVLLFLVSFSSYSMQIDNAYLRGNVGVGSLNPGAALDIQGEARMTAFNLSTSPTSNYFLRSDSSGNGTWQPVIGGSFPQIQYNNGTSLSGIGSGGTDGTNVGIGTVSFVNRLNIAGNVGISTLSNSPYLTNTLANPGALVIDGNVGIGTFKPQEAIDIRGVEWVEAIDSIDTTGNNYGVATTNSMAYGFSASPDAIDATPNMGAFAFGHTLCGHDSGVACGTIIQASGAGSLSGGYAYQGNSGEGQRILSSGQGSFLWGDLEPVGNSAIASSGSGSIAMGRVASAFGAAALESSGPGSIAMGDIEGSYGSVWSTGKGSIAIGYADSSDGSPGKGIYATNNGSIAMGAIKTLNTYSVTLHSTGYGSVAMGHAAGNNVSSNIGILASGNGSVAMGEATTILQSTGTGAIAIGQDVQSLQNNSITFGHSLINNKAQTFQVGFSNALPTFYVDSNNVGIGTYQPTQALDIWGTIRTTQTFMQAGNVGITTTGTACTITAIHGGIISAATCT